MSSTCHRRLTFKSRREAREYAVRQPVPLTIYRCRRCGLLHSSLSPQNGGTRREGAV